MNCTFEKSDKNELRMKIENGIITEATVYYKDVNGLEAGKAELEKMGFTLPNWHTLNEKSPASAPTLTGQPNKPTTI